MPNEPTDHQPDQPVQPVGADSAAVDDQDVVAHGAHDEDDPPFCVACSMGA